MHFTSQTSSNGVIERDFTLGEVPGLLFSPASGPDHAPLILMAHGGGQHKRAPGILGRARHYVTSCGFHVAALDAPGHGDRPRTATDEQHVTALRQAQAAGEPIAAIVVQLHLALAERAVPEWQATIDALQKLPEIGTEAPIGFWGIMQGTGIGVPLTAVEPRITAAVFGCLGHEYLTEAAAQITIPIEFLLQWDDEHIDRQSGLALFDAFASKEKTLHANAGGHAAVPRFEVDSAGRFFARHLGPDGK
ncbi:MULTISPECIES: alpha/beta hydrolase [unclassified Nocardia]|uniref:alpha/beta hydrolase n=1 Tax=unclassified Nocardia TaxID=2637762 RepID=UPI0034369967